MTRIKQSTGIAGAALTLTTLGLSLVAASPASAGSVPAACNGVVEGGQNQNVIHKTITGIQKNKDGSYTEQFTFTSSRSSGTFDKVLDCVFLDANKNSSFDHGETIIAGTEQSYTITNHVASGSITFTNPDSSVTQVCDRIGARSSSSTGKSNFACVGLPPTPVPAGSVGGLGVAGLGAIALGGALIYRRRRGAPSAV